MASRGSLIINDGVRDDSSSGLSSFTINVSCSSPPVFVGSGPKRAILYSATGEITEVQTGSIVTFRLEHARLVAGSLSGRIVLNGETIQSFTTDRLGGFSFFAVGEPTTRIDSGSFNLALGLISMSYASASSSSSSDALHTFLVVDYHYEEIASSFRMTNTFSRRIDRIASSNNPMMSAKVAVSEYAGCDEASMVRKRAIALHRTRLSISGEEFRFRLPE